MLRCQCLNFGDSPPCHHACIYKGKTFYCTHRIAAAAVSITMRTIQHNFGLPTYVD